MAIQVYVISGKTVLGDLFKQVARFAVVGGATFIAYNAMLYVFIEVVLLPVLAGSALAYLIALVANYWLHYSWTFSAEGEHVKVSRRYLIMVGSGFVFNLVAMWVVQRQGWNYLVAQNLILIIIIGWNFLLGRTWVFKS